MALYSQRNARQSLIDTVAFRVLSRISALLGYVVIVRGMAIRDFGAINLLSATALVKPRHRRTLTVRRCLGSAIHGQSHWSYRSAHAETVRIIARIAGHLIAMARRDSMICRRKDMSHGYEK